jgi:uncharacterized membrane protein (UPF0136 family)
MKRLLATRFGFFAAAALICFSLLTVIESQHRWVPIAIGSLYVLLSVVFFFEERPRPPRP